MAATTRTARTAPVLDAAAAAAHDEVMAGARKFELAATWAEAHPAPVEDLVVDAYGTLEMFGDQPVTLAGEGAPGMSEFAVAEFAAAIGVSTYTGRNLIGSALECKYRLPRIWARVMKGEIPVWKVRKVTDRTHRLPMPAAAVVDRELAPVLDSCTFAQIERAVATLEAKVDSERAEEQRVERWEQQHLDIELTHAGVVGNDGLVPVHGLLDYTDALALQQALQAKAHDLHAEHPDLTLDIRRAMALGRLATASLGSGGKQVVIYTHFDPADAHGIVDVEKSGYTTIEQIQDWCTTAGTKVSIRPVMELDQEQFIDRYEPTPAQHEQAILTTPTCVFRNCGKHARDCDLDHIVPWADGGKTTSWNLAPLCRFHHRIKTHGDWHYRRLTRTTFEWTSPKGKVHPVDITDKRRHIR